MYVPDVDADVIKVMTNLSYARYASFKDFMDVPLKNNAVNVSDEVDVEEALTSKEKYRFDDTEGSKLLRPRSANTYQERQLQSQYLQMRLDNLQEW